MSPIFTSGLPLVRSINAVSLTKSKGSIRNCPLLDCLNLLYLLLKILSCVLYQ